MIIGNTYIDIQGKTSVINVKTNERCDIQWKERGWSGKNAYQVEGVVKNSTGKPVYRMHGKFIEKLSLVNLESPGQEDEIIWTANP